jgi:hypothetical protein
VQSKVVQVVVAVAAQVELLEKQAELTQAVVVVADTTVVLTWQAVAVQEL